MTRTAIRLLQVEDSEGDAAFVLRNLERFGFRVTSECVDSLEDFRAALEQDWDIIISDYRLVGFSASDVLDLLHKSGKDLPFIVVSGTIGEEVAVQMMLSGAHDYLMKDDLARLGPAVTREIRESARRRAKREADAALRDSENRLALALSAARMGVWTANLKDGAVFWSERCYEISGLREFDNRVESFYQLVVSEDADRVRDAVERAITTHSIFSCEFRIRRADGTVVWIANLGHVDYDSNNEPWRLVGTIEDITERKAAEDELQHQRMMLKSVLEAARDAVIVTRIDGRVVLWNAAAEHMFGWASGEALGRRLDELIVPTRYLEIFASTLDQLKREGMAFAAGSAREQTGRRKDGSEFPLEVSMGLVELSGALHAVGVFRDISDRKRAEIDREKLYAQFLQAQKMESVGRLAGGIAHDFNNHLTVINGYSALLLRGLPPGHHMRDPLDQISSSGERAAALVRQLLTFSRKDKAERVLLNLNELILAMERSLLRLVGEDIRVITRLQPALDTVMADRHQMEQVLMNLAVNGRDAMPQGGVLSIETGRQWLDGVCDHCGAQIEPGYFIDVTVRDTGTGIDEGVREKLFEPFFTTKDVGKGTGLGLSVVQAVVAENGGHLRVDSALGRGTAFHVFLPAVAGEAKARMERPAPAKQGYGTILLVEDEYEVRRLMVEVLQSCGYRVVSAGSGAEALSKLESSDYDLLITDVKMPGMGGSRAGSASNQRPAWHEAPVCVRLLR